MLRSYQLNICNSNLLLESGHSIPKGGKKEMIFLCSTEGRGPFTHEFRKVEFSGLLWKWSLSYLTAHGTQEDYFH